MATRSAHHTINGFHYQFDKSILEILRTVDETTLVRLEGIEDIDVLDKAIQCKYHATQKYKRSAIKKPLVAFLNHFVSGAPRLQYILYVHFNDHSSFKKLDVAELKAIASDEIKKLTISNADLNTFVTRHLTYEPALHIDEQRKLVHSELQKVLKCSANDAKLYFYSNSLHEVMRLSRSVTDNATTRKAFVEAINHKRVLFSAWLSQLESGEKYTKYVRAQLAKWNALKNTNVKCFHIDSQELLSNVVF